MKMLNNVVNVAKKVSTSIALSFFSIMAFAANDDSSLTNLNDFHTKVVLNTGGTIFKIAVAIATIAGILLIIKGLVHLKQNYTGTGQEKHLSKGIASLGFGTALILVIPISHLLVGTAGTSTTFDTNVGTALNFTGGSTPAP